MVDGAWGGTWRMVRDIHGLWHVPIGFGAGQSWVDKSINVPYWGADSGKSMSGKAFIIKAQEEWERATCLTMDFHDDQAAVDAWATALDGNPLYNVDAGAFIHPDYVHLNSRIRS